jgi:CheY-like chemotaxis protein/signal transduction histidine kinase
LMVSFYMAMLVLNLNSITKFSSLTLYVLYYIFFYVFVGVFVGLLLTWIAELYHSFIESKLTLTEWANKQTLNYTCAFSLTIGLTFAVIALLLVFNVVVADFATLKNLGPEGLLEIELTRVFVSIFTYVVPSRIVRELLVDAKRNLDVKTEFVKYFSHEMRTPLSVMDIALTLLESELMQDDLTSVSNQTCAILVGDMKASVRSMLEILDDLLLYEKLERSNIVMNFTHENPIKLLQQTVAGYNNNNITILPYEVGDSAHKVARHRLGFNVDSTKLSLILNALLAPAIAVKESTGSVEISLETVCSSSHSRTDARNQYSTAKVAPLDGDLNLCIVISDMRSGLCLHDVKQLHIDTLTFDRVGHDDNCGSGFGLWIAKKLINFHDATIETLVLPNGIGLQYRISFPMVFMKSEPSFSGIHEYRTESSKHAAGEYVAPPDEDCVVAATVDGEDELELTPYRQGLISALDKVPSKMKILLIDDSTMVRKMMVKLIQGLGHTTFEADDGATGVMLMRKLAEDGVCIDCILMDNQMPIMMGVDAAKVMREELLYDGVILGVTGNALEEDIRQFKSNGADEIIIKPLNKDNFETAFHNMWRKRKLTS